MYRFPPDDLAPYLLREWLVYRPLQVYIARMLGMEDSAHRLRYLLFPGLYRPTESADFTDMLRMSTMNHLSCEIGLQDWRDIELTFVQQFYDHLHQTFMVPAHYAQRGHSLRVGVGFYGQVPNIPNGVPYQVIKSQLESSEFWQDLTSKSFPSCLVDDALISTVFAAIQRFPELDPSPNESLEAMVRRVIQTVNRLLSQMDETTLRRREVPSTTMGTVSTVQPYGPMPSSVVDISPSASRIVCPHPSNLEKLRRFRKDENAEFTCPEQAQALDAVLGGIEHVFLIGPTGMGKTSVFLIPATESPDKVTIALIPLSALRIDFERRCYQLGIHLSEWTEGCQQKATIVMVSPENAMKPPFLSWAKNLYLQGLLLRIVVDEVQFYTMHKSFRRCFSAHRQLVQSSEWFPCPLCFGELILSKGVPFLLMTATCPPELEREILEPLSIPSCLVIRAATPRPEISYNVHILNDRRSAEAELMKSVEDIRASYAPGEKGLVFCRTHTLTENCAFLLGCPSYHRDQRTVSDLRDTYDRFLEDDDQTVMVATSLLGAGVDIPHIRDVWHFGIPWSLIDFVQETGRGGRDGKPAYSHLLTWRNELETTPREMHYTEDTMRQWVAQTSDCRRTLIGQVLDNKWTSCVLLKHSNRCDRCRAHARCPRPPSEITFFPSPGPDYPTGPPPPPARRTSDLGPAAPVHEPSPTQPSQSPTVCEEAPQDFGSEVSP